MLGHIVGGFFFANFKYLMCLQSSINIFVITFFLILWYKVCNNINIIFYPKLFLFKALVYHNHPLIQRDTKIQSKFNKIQSYIYEIDVFDYE